MGSATCSATWGLVAITGHLMCVMYIMLISSLDDCGPDPKPGQTKYYIWFLLLSCSEFSHKE